MNFFKWTDYSEKLKEKTFKCPEIFWKLFDFTKLKADKREVKKDLMGQSIGGNFDIEFKFSIILSLCPLSWASFWIFCWNYIRMESRGRQVISNCSPHSIWTSSRSKFKNTSGCISEVQKLAFWYTIQNFPKFWVISLIYAGEEWIWKFHLSLNYSLHFKFHHFFLLLLVFVVPSGLIFVFLFVFAEMTLTQ